MFELIYSSTAVTSLNDDELEILLGTSRHHNEVNGITGLLLHVHTESTRSAYFVQVLEGPQAAVERTYERITQDELHSDVQLLGTRQIGRRAFGDWTMRLEELSTVQLQLAARTSPDADPPTRSAGDVVRDAQAIEALILRYTDRAGG